MDEIYKSLESGDKTIDVTPEDKMRSDGMQPEGWAERTGYRNNEIPANPPYKAKVYNLVQLNCEEFKSFLIESGVTVVKLEEHNGFCVEVETQDDLAFIVSLDGEYYDEDHGEDALPIKVRVLYESRYNNHFQLTELTRDMLQGAGAEFEGVASSAPRSIDFRASAGIGTNMSGFSREEMGAGGPKQQQQSDVASVMLDRTKFARADNVVDGASSQLNFRDTTKSAAPTIFFRSSDSAQSSHAPDLAFRQKAPAGGLSDMRSGTSCVSTYQSTYQQQNQQKRIYQPPQISGLASRRPVGRKAVDENGWTLNS